MMDLFATSSSDDGEQLSETPAAADGPLKNEEGGASLNETHCVEGGDQEKGAEEVDGNGEDNGGGPLSGLIDQAKYISQSLDGTLSKLMKLKGNIQEASTKLRQNRENSERTVESLQKITSDLSSFTCKMAELRGAMDKGRDRVYSAEKIAQDSQVQVEEYDPQVETPNVAPAVQNFV